MTSATTGWALRWTKSPAVIDDAYLALARTTDGARTWTSVTPPAAAPLLSTRDASAILDAITGERAWLAVTAADQDNSSVHPTEVFGTANGGRNWTESVPIRAPSYAQFLSFAGPRYGWLLIAYGGAMGQEPVQIYRTTDGGLRWSLAAKTSQAPYARTGRNGLPVYCDKADVTFATAEEGWISGACNLLVDALLASHNGGAHWAPQPLPIPAHTCNYSGCLVSGPQFCGRAGFLLIEGGPPAAYFLTSHDLGVTWQQEPLPPGAGKDPSVQFFSPDNGILISGGPQGAVGRTFHVTADGGRTWIPVRQGRPFRQLGVSFDFVSTRIGFAWILGADDTTPSAPAMFETTDSGQTWIAFTPRLAAG